MKRQKREKCFYEDPLAAQFKPTLDWVQKIEMIQPQKEEAVSPIIKINMKRDRGFKS